MFTVLIFLKIMNNLEKEIGDYVYLKLFGYGEEKKIPREEMIYRHAACIDLLKDLWISTSDRYPQEKQLVLTIEDVSLKSRKVTGRFVSEYYYEDGHFVANLGDTDPYGSMTHWCDASTAWERIKSD